MDQHLVFAISREYGSGGREIGERLASELGIAYYDKLLLKRIAEESGLSGDMVEDFDNLSECDARSRIARVDKNRASYYRYFTDENWGQARNYDLCINSGNLDALGAVSVIKTFVEARQS